MKCPFCKDIEMKVAPELGKDWHQCPSCGGTEIENPNYGDGGSLISVEKSFAGNETKYKPGAGVVARAKRAREDGHKTKPTPDNLVIPGATLTKEGKK